MPMGFHSEIAPDKVDIDTEYYDTAGKPHI